MLEMRKVTYQALSLVKAGEEERAEEELELADAALLEAHNMQTKFLAQEGGAKSDITALFVHSQDHLMTSITEINLIKEIIDLRKELKSWLKQKLYLEETEMVKIALFCAAGFLQACW